MTLPNPGGAKPWFQANACTWVGVGRCAGVEHRTEAVVLLSSFPYAVASSGPIRSHGGLEVCAIDETSELDEGPDRVREKHPSSVASNLKIVMDGPGISVTGDVRATGEVVLGRDVSVGGAVLPNEDPVNLPQVRLSDFDTKDKPGVVHLTQDTFAKLEVDGYSRLDRDLKVGQGLHLQNGVLYVAGDLEVEGGITGTGAVIVTGKTIVRGTGGYVGTKSSTALVSAAGVELLGEPNAYQGFQGMTYTEGDFRAWPGFSWPTKPWAATCRSTTRGFSRCRG